MKKGLRIILLLKILTLVGCVEIKDNESGFDFDKLVIRQPIYIFENQLLDENHYLNAIKTSKIFLNGNSSSKPVKLKIGSLKMEPHGVLYTMGKRVEFEIDYLHSDSGEIATFPENFVNEKGHAGLSGGLLVFHIKSGEGTLNISMRGQKGGMGYDGNPPDEKLRGAEGPQGQPGFRIQSLGHPNLHVNPGNGGEGGRGQRGYPGQKGQKGGNSGIISFYLQSNNGLFVRLDKQAGPGGEGGRGGAGGRGGPGGKPGVSPFGASIEPKHGEEGPRGEVGPQGLPGDNGLIEVSCLYIDSRENCFN